MRVGWTMTTDIKAMMLVLVIVSADASLPVRPAHQSHNQIRNQVCVCGTTIMLLMTMAKVIKLTMRHPVKALLQACSNAMQPPLQSPNAKHVYVCIL